MSQLLVERETEIGALRGLLSSAAAGDGRLVLLEGPAGIGKTRLLSALCDEAAGGGIPVLRGRGSPLERDFPFGVARQLFEPAFVEGRRDGLLRGAAAAAETVLGPVAADAEQAGSFAALHGLYWLTLNLAGDEPLLIAVDDLHAADRPSLRFAGYLARRLAGAPVLVAATVRAGEPGSDPALLAELTADPGTTHVVPRPLTEAGVAELIGDMLGEPPEARFSAACVAATGGNPLLLSQLLVALAAEAVAPRAANVDAVMRIGPQAVSRTVLLRLAALPDDARAVAQAVAVLGDGSAREPVARLAGLDEARVDEANRALASAGIFDAASRSGFAHALLRDAVYLDMSGDARRAQHRRAVALLRELGAPDEQVAAQLLATPPGEEPWAVEVLRATGGAAVVRGAPDAAVGPLRRALDEPLAARDRAELLFELGRAELLVDVQSAITHLREAWGLQEGPEARAQNALALAMALAFAGEPDDSLAVARRAIAEIPTELDDLRCALEAIVAFDILVGEGGPDDMARIETFARGGRSDGVGGDMLGLVAGWYAMCRCVPVEESVGLVRRSLTDRLLAADDGTFAVVGVIALGMADQPDAAAVADRIQAVARRQGSVVGDAALQLWRGFVMHRGGELVEAEALLRDAIVSFPTWSSVSIGPLFAAGWLARVLLDKGDVAAAAAELARHDVLSVSAEGARRWRRAYAEVLLAQGEFNQALAVTQESAKRDDRILCPAADTWRAPMALALAGLGRAQEAIEVAEGDVELARGFGCPPVLGRTLRVLGTVAGDMDALAAAVDALGGSPARLEHAKALAAYGAAMRRAGAQREAREPLREALELADRCGAAGLADTVRVELKAAGVRPRTTALKGPDALTPSERRVAAMAAEGLSNREIAQALYVTPKTVEVHLYNTFRKLEISSRRELPSGLTAA